MSDPTQRMQVLGEAGESCRECGAALAADQRYCLNCGRRRGEPRVDFERHLPAENGATGNGVVAPPPANGVAPAATAPPEQKPQRDYAPLAAVGGIAVLGVMLLLGVLIGKGDDSASAPPQVVRLGEEGGTAAGGDEGEAGNAEEKAAKQAKGKGSGKAAKSAGGIPDTGNAVEASDEALQELQEQSPEEYQESSAKLPDEIATGGAPPPEDSKAPGGGSKGTAIE